MRRTIQWTILLFLIVLTFSLARAQEYSIVRTKDTVSLRMMVFPAQINEFLLPSYFNAINSTDSSTTKALRAEFIRSQILSFPITVGGRSDLATALRLQPAGDHHIDLLQTAVNAMVAGGEAYMVYLAMKKYGYVR